MQYVHCLARQAYYQRLGYQYQEAAEESIILDLIAELRKDMGRMGGRKLWHEINEAHPKMISRDKFLTYSTSII